MSEDEIHNLKLALKNERRLREQLFIAANSYEDEVLRLKKELEECTAAHQAMCKEYEAALAENARLADLPATSAEPTEPDYHERHQLMEMAAEPAPKQKEE
jgi:hypothetical protein